MAKNKLQYDKYNTKTGSRNDAKGTDNIFMTLMKIVRRQSKDYAHFFKIFLPMSKSLVAMAQIDFKNGKYNNICNN
jgi:hypothetical protein